MKAESKPAGQCCDHRASSGREVGRHLVEGGAIVRNQGTGPPSWAAAPCPVRTTALRLRVPGGTSAASPAWGPGTPRKGPPFTGEWSSTNSRRKSRSRHGATVGRSHVQRIGGRNPGPALPAPAVGPGWAVEKRPGEHHRGGHGDRTVGRVVLPPPMANPAPCCPDRRVATGEQLVAWLPVAVTGRRLLQPFGPSSPPRWRESHMETPHIAGDHQACIVTVGKGLRRQHHGASCVRSQERTAGRLTR